MEEFNPLDSGMSPAKAISRFGEFDSLLPEEYFIKVVEGVGGGGRKIAFLP